MNLNTRRKSSFHSNQKTTFRFELKIYQKNMKARVFMLLMAFPILFFVSCNNSEESEDGLNPATNSLSTDTSGSDSVVNRSVRQYDDPNQSDTAKAYVMLENLITACLENDYTAAASMIAYVGMDSTRIMDSYNPNDPDELENVKTTAEAIQFWLTDNSYYFDDIWIESAEGYKFIIQEVVFGIDSYYFILFDRGDRLLLSNISSQSPV